MRTFAAALLIALLLAATANAAGKRTCQATGDGLGCVKVSGSSGWIEFCPPPTVDDNDKTETDGADSGCVSFRPFGFEEFSTTGTSLEKVNNLKPTVGLTTTSQFSQWCNNNNLVCANTTDDKPLNYTRIPMTMSLTSGQNPARLKVDVYIIHSDGVVSFGGQRLNVKKGGYKFNVIIDNYSFKSNGARVEFDIVTKVKGRSSNDVVATNSSIDGIIQNFAKFAYVTAGSSTIQWEYVDVSTKTRGSQKVATFSFKGPFTNMMYDPIVGDVSAAAPAAALISAVLMALLALLL